MEEFLLELIRLSPQLGILIYFLIYFKKELKSKDLEVKELNESLRADQKENLLTITKLTNVIKELKELIKTIK